MQLAELQFKINAAYSECFSAVNFEIPPEDAEYLSRVDFDGAISEVYFGELGRSHPKVSSCSDHKCCLEISDVALSASFDSFSGGLYRQHQHCSQPSRKQILRGGKNSKRRCMR